MAAIPVAHPHPTNYSTNPPTPTKSTLHLRTPPPPHMVSFSFMHSLLSYISTSSHYASLVYCIYGTL